MSDTVQASRVKPKHLVWAGAGTIALGIATASILLIPSHEQTIQPQKPRIWCSHGVYSEGLMVYTESDQKEKGRELGKPSLVSLSDFSKPLAVSCQEDGTVWLVNSKTIIKGKISSDPTCCSVDLEQEISHTRAPEYQIDGAEVVAASIWLPAGGSRPAVATVTNNGWFQVFMPPSDGPVVQENFIFSLKDNPLLKENVKWPEKVTGAAVGVLGPNEFAIIPFGENTHIIYYVKWPGGPYKALVPVDLWSMDMRTEFPNLVSINGSLPVIFNADRGGWVTRLQVITTDKGQTEIPTVVKPREILLQEQKH
ncbi:Uncharacterised protein [Candidatus Bilamarchaeum dharawalense]|uniref:Uncharacterized protein n=1 Tax=Candidatus Bilamarchaeum dharawalense TaxID=2885759 RepID=A0A5E4LQP2_9ARCH|nr:Uncharacterised protein [Candidatus Bilamarchaeum dharawalense]